MPSNNDLPRALVTGGAGFLGSHLCERLLADGYEVLCLDTFYSGSKDNIAHLLENPLFEVHEHDIVQPFFEHVSQIYNLACTASPKDYERDAVYTMKTSVNGAINMLALARDTRAKILHASAEEVYRAPEGHLLAESCWDHVGPNSLRACYEEGQRCAEALFFTYQRQYDVLIKMARIFDTYGPRMPLDDGGAVSSFIVQALRGEPITIHGDGSQTRSFCYVDDVIDGFIRLMNTPDEFCGPVNIGSPGAVTVLELAELILDLTNSHSKLIFKELPAGQAEQRKPAISLPQNELAWQPKVGLRDGLLKTLAFFEQRIAGAVSFERMLAA